MKVSSTTFCGRCNHAGMKREVRQHKGLPEKTVSVIYSCLNEACERAEGVLLSYDGNLTAYIREPGDLVGSIITYRKAELDDKFLPAGS